MYCTYVLIVPFPLQMKPSNNFLQCFYISSAAAIIICSIGVYTRHYNISGLSSQQLEEDINGYSTLNFGKCHTYIYGYLLQHHIIC